MTEPTRILVSGSRSIDDYHVVSEAIRESPWDMETLVVGDADGVDTAALAYSKRHDIESERHVIPDWVWEKVGSKAGPMRNGYMVEQSEALIAVWNGESSGTKDAIKQAESAGLPVYKVICSEHTGGWVIDRTDYVSGDQASLTEFK